MAQTDFARLCAFPTEANTNGSWPDRIICLNIYQSTVNMYELKVFSVQNTTKNLTQGTVQYIAVPVQDFDVKSTQQ